MERRKDTPYKGTKIPKDYLRLVEEAFAKTFKKATKRGETFAVHGEMYPDEIVLCVSLKQEDNLRSTTCYGSVDYPPPSAPKTEGGNAAGSTADLVQAGVNQCVDAVASFFNAFFDEGRPIDYDLEYRQNWTVVELEKNQKTYLRINRDNPDLEAAADEILERAEDAEASAKKKKLH